MSMISEIAEYLEDQGLGTQGTDLFYGYLPDNSEFPAILVRDTGGTKPDQDITEIHNPTFQIFIRAESYATGKVKLAAIRSLFHRVLKTYLVDDGILFRKILAISEGGHIGRNEAGLEEFSMNFTASIVE